MDATDGRKLAEAVLNERRRRAVKMRLGGATLAETAKLSRVGGETGFCLLEADRQPAESIQPGMGTLHNLSSGLVAGLVAFGGGRSWRATPRLPCGPDRL